MQTESVEGEPEGLTATEDGPLWADLPAVRAGRVHIVDRFGYAGVAGRVRLVEDLVELLGR